MHRFSNVQKLPYHHILAYQDVKIITSRNYFYNEMDSCTIKHYFQDASTSWKKTATQLHLQHDIIVITQSPQQIIVLTTIRRSCMVGDFKEMHHFFSTRLNGPHLYGTLWHLFASLAYSWACQHNHSESTWSWHHSSLKHILNPPTFAVLLYVQPFMLLYHCFLI